MSDKKSFIIENLDLRKSPGLPRGLAAYRDFSPYVNIIYGPNASGKSSTVRAILQLIWQESRHGVTLDGTARIGEDQWVFQIDHQPVLTQKNGIRADLTGIPAAEVKNHYSLSIDDLFVDDHADLAGEISRQAIGGFDLKKAADRLRYSDHILPASIGEYKAYRQARDEVRSIVEDQQNLKAEQSRLADLRKEEEEARKAQSQLEYYNLVRECFEKSAEVAVLEEKLKTYPENSKLFGGKEWEQVEELEKDIEKSRETIREATQKIEMSEEQLTSLDLPANEFSSGLLKELRERVKNLEESERRAGELNREIVGLESEMDHSLKSIAPDTDPSAWKGLELLAVKDLDEWLSDAHQLLSRLYIARNQIDSLNRRSEEISSVNHSEETLRKGLMELSEWLKTESIDFQYSTFLMVILSLMSTGAGLYWIFAGSHQGVAVTLIVLSVIVLAVYFYKNHTRKNNHLARWQKNYTESGMKSPDDWNSAEVSKRIGEIVSELDRKSRLRQIEEERRRREDDLERNERRLATLHQRMDRFRSLYGAAPASPDYDEEDYMTFYWFIRSVTEWQDLSREYEARLATRNQCQKESAEELQRINDLFAKYFEAEAANDHVEAEARFREIDEKVQTRNEVLKDMEFQILRKNDALARLETQEKKLKELYESLKLKPGDKQRLRRILDQLEGYKEISKEYEAALSVERERRHKVKLHSLFQSEDIEGEIWTQDRLRQRIEDLEKMAENYVEIREKITKTETKIGAKQKEDQLEKALDTVEKTRSALEEKYMENLHSRAGNLLVRQIAEKTQELNQPQILKRANQLLAMITQYRYELLSGSTDGGGFFVRDLTQNIGLELRELSAGTRVQVLLAIKIAYLELQESGLKLPLLADELLANSDDIRAPAIIEALTELSREGRQIFYFTAQYDEMRAWKQHLKKVGVRHSSYILGEAHEEMRRPVVEDLPQRMLISVDIPRPDGLTHEEYGKFLHPDFHLLEDETEQLPLYFLVENIGDLYVLLKKGIHNWGQFNHFLRSGGQSDLTDHDKKKMEEKVRLLARFQAMYRRGRPRRTGRSVIENSGAVSATHMENVMALLREVEGNPELLIDGLRAGKVSRFHSHKIDELKEYLITHGFLDPSPKMEEDKIRTAMEAQVSRMETCSREEAEKFLQLILDHQRKPGTEKAEEIS